MVFYLSYRKFVAPLGIMCLGSIIAITYKYLTTHTITYALFDVVATGLSVLFLNPFFRNQVVEIVDGSIIVHSYSKKIALSPDNWEMMRRDKHGNTSYYFLKNGKRYVVTPDLYGDNESMLSEFERIFNVRDDHAPKQRQTK